MDRKVTRRVVLGTAIAGLAVGPFVIRSLRNRSVPLSDNREREWNKYYSMVSGVVPVEVSRQEEGIDWALRLERCAGFRFVTVAHSEYMDEYHSGSDVPSVFWVKEGKASYDDGEGVLCLILEKDSLRGLWKTRDDEPKKFNFMNSDGRLVSVSNESGVWSEKCTELSGTLRDLFFIERPTRGVVRLGSKWTSADYAGLPFEAAGVFSVDGVMTLLLKAERAYGNVQMQEYMKGLCVWRKQHGIDCDGIQEVESVKKSGLCMTVLRKSYVNIESGLVYRQEEILEHTATDGNFTPERTRTTTQCFVV
jgi:hypothetical protein